MSSRLQLIDRIKQRVNSLLFKNNLWWIFGIIICVLILGYVISYFIPAPAPSGEGGATDVNPGNRIREIIGFLCGLASIFGIALALLQNVNTKDELDMVKQLAQADAVHEKELRKALQKANAEHNAELKKLKAEITKHQQTEVLQKVAGRLRNTILLLNEKDLKENIGLIIWSCYEIIEDINPIKLLLKEWGMDDMGKDITEHLRKIGTNKNHFLESKRKGVEGLLIEEITKEFSAFQTTVLDLKAKLNA